MIEEFGPIKIEVYQPDYSDLSAKAFADELGCLIKTINDLLKRILKEERVIVDIKYINVLDTLENPFGDRGFVLILGRRNRVLLESDARNLVVDPTDKP